MYTMPISVAIPIMPVSAKTQCQFQAHSQWCLFQSQCTRFTGSFPAVRRPECGVDYPSPPTAEVKERVQLYLYSPSGISWPVQGWTLPSPSVTIRTMSFSITMQTTHVSVTAQTVYVSRCLATTQTWSAVEQSWIMNSWSGCETSWTTKPLRQGRIFCCRPIP